MRLIERQSYIDSLKEQFSKIADGEGHCIFVCGESGIGKTSLLKAFTKDLKKDYQVYEGTCDALFTPRPLAPLYDIAWQIRHDLIDSSTDLHDRAGLFSRFFQELKKQDQISIIVFEDIHWADEATIDFIKFMGRRITHLQCMFILTYRDNEIHPLHPLSNIFGQLSPDSFTRIALNPLSQEAVIKLAEEKGYDGEKVFEVSGGNPFYVNEILSSYSEGVPANIRDAIISAYNRTNEKTRQVWDLLSVIPGKFEIKYLEKFAPAYLEAVDNCMQLQILIQQEGQIFFKHELFRIAIENHLSPLRRVSLNKTILELFLRDFEENNEIERIVHHSKNANAYDLVVKYAPIAAKSAACVGSHIEASKLLYTAIEFFQGDDPDIRISMYESYAYECYLTNSIKQAIIYAGKTLRLLKAAGDVERTADCMRFLSHLRCCDGDRKTALSLGLEAIGILSEEPPSKVKAMAFSNISQLKMHFDDLADSMDWAMKSFAVARGLNDEEALCPALINIGTLNMIIPSSWNEGVEQLRKSLSISLKNSYHEHAARAYANLARNAFRLKDYEFVNNILEDGIRYSDERELPYWNFTILSVKARLMFDKGKWNEAYIIAEKLLNHEYHGSFEIHAVLVMALIKMRKGEFDEAFQLIIKAKALTSKGIELQTMIPLVVASLEYEWLTAQRILETDDLNMVLKMIEGSALTIENSELAFWLMKVRKQHLALKEVYEGYHVKNVAGAHKAAIHKAAAHWNKLGNPYARAMVLFEGSDDDKKDAISIVQDLGADSAFERMKLEMRSSGIKGIPRGLRKSTKLNAALLTGREMDVLELLKDGLQNKEIANKLFISAKTVDHHISAILFKLDVNSRVKAVNEAIKLELIK